MRSAIGIGLGGTNLKGDPVDETGHVVCKGTVPSPGRLASAAGVVESLVGFGAESREPAGGLGITSAGYGFGVPNFIEAPQWIQRQVNNLPGLNDYPLRPPLAVAFGQAIAIDNDVMNAVLAEYYFGGGQQ